jgi:catechol 2,3-dioxygenase
MSVPSPLMPDLAPEPAELATFGPVHLRVVDGERSLRFWRDVVGLRALQGGADALALGATDEPLLVLHPGATSRAQPRHSGLYHVALHLPDAAEFARVLARLMAYDWPIAPTDHVMSESIYLNDPDGLGLELTLETPERMRSMRFTAMGFEVIDADGRQRSGHDPLDVDRVLAALRDRDIERSLPAGTKVGHLHLHVADLDAAVRFYRDGIGFIEHSRSDALGMADLHAGGTFPHRLAVNTWQGQGAPQPPAGSAGLQRFTVVLDSQARFREVAARLAEAERRDDGLLVKDPAGNVLLLTAAGA